MVKKQMSARTLLKKYKHLDRKLMILKAKLSKIDTKLYKIRFPKKRK